MPVEGAAQAVTAPDPADFQAYKAARVSGKTIQELTPATAPDKPGEQAVSESTSEPAGKLAEAEATPKPEEGKNQESAKPNESEEHSPRWYRREVKRIQRETREQVAALEAKLAEMKQPAPAAAPAALVPELSAEPKEDDFSTIADYTRALTKYHAEQIAKKEVADFRQSVDRQLATEQAEVQTRQQKAAQSLQDQKWAEKVERGKKNHADFEDAVFDAGEDYIAPWTAQAVQQLDNAEEVAYFMAKNPQESMRISTLPQFQQVLELGALNARFNGKATPKNNSAESRQPQPKPITPIGGSNESAAGDDINSPTVVNDYSRWKRMKEAQKNRR